MIHVKSTKDPNINKFYNFFYNFLLIFRLLFSIYFYVTHYGDYFWAKKKFKLNIIKIIWFGWMAKNHTLYINIMNPYITMICIIFYFGMFQHGNYNFGWSCKKREEHYVKGKKVVEAFNYNVKCQQHSSIAEEEETLESKDLVPKLESNSSELNEKDEKSPCAIVIRKQSDKVNGNRVSGDGAHGGRSAHNIRKSLKKLSDRNSVLSNSSVEAPDESKSNDVGESSSESNCDVNIEYGSSVFYVVWD